MIRLSVSGQPGRIKLSPADLKEARLYLTGPDTMTETNWLYDRKMIHVTCALNITWYVPSMYHFILTTVQQLEIKVSISSE